MAENPILDAALKYISMGFSVVPLPPPFIDKKTGKISKVPMVTWGPYQKKLPSEEEIHEWFEGHPERRVSIVTGAISDLLVVDCDTVEAQNKLEEFIAEAKDTFITPLAKSPHGYHFYFHNNPRISTDSKIAGILGFDVRAEGGLITAPPSAGLNGKGYSWIQDIAKVEIAELPINLEEFLVSSILSYRGGYGGGFPDATSQQQSATIRNKMFEYGTRDDDLFHTANCLCKGGMPQEEMRQILERLILSWGENPDSKWIEAKIQSALKRGQEKERNLTHEIREIISATSGNINATWLYNSLQIATSEMKAKARVVLCRLVEAGMLERTGRFAGEYRIVEHRYTVKDLSQIEQTRMDIRLPLGMEQFAAVKPKNIISFAGVKDGGKSALLLECARLNINSGKVWFFSFEADEEEIWDRIKEYPDQGLASRMMKEIKWVDDPPNYFDIIQPDGINIIDYVEPKQGENAYVVHDIMRGIHERLKKGIAILAIQKKTGKDDPFGGEYTLAKTRLACNVDKLDKHVSLLKIQKCKIRSDNARAKNINPIGYGITFKIRDGIVLIPEGVWREY